MQIQITQEALEEEAEAYLFYEDQLNGLGDRFLNELHETLLKISLHPIYYSYSDHTFTIRDVNLKSFPFVLIFEIKDDYILIYHIHHTSKSK